MMENGDFVRLAIKWFGSRQGWKSALARETGLSTRTLRRIELGQCKVTEITEDKLRNLLDADMPEYDHAHWIVGKGEDGRDYIIHAYWPRFLAVISGADEAEDVRGPVKLLDGGNRIIHSLLWIDDGKHQNKSKIEDILEEAAHAYIMLLDYSN